VQGAWNREREGRYFSIKFITVIGDHLVAALHAANRRGDHGAAGILETLARFQMRLLSDNAFTFYFLDIAVGVRDQPVTRQ